MADLNRLYRREKALHEVDFDYHGFEWIDCHNYDDSTLSYIRRAKDPNDFLVVACNFTPVPRVRLPPGRARSSAGTRRSSTAIRRTTAAATWATARA